jgi:hypothetical protein
MIATATARSQGVVHDAVRRGDGSCLGVLDGAAMKPRWSWVLWVVVASGCATARLVGQAPGCPRDPGIPRTLVLEPLFEVAEWQAGSKTEYARVVSPVLGGSDALGLWAAHASTAGSGAPTTIAISRQVREKPLFAQAPILSELHRRLFVSIQRLRPSWRVTSTSAVPTLAGPVRLVRTVISSSATVASDRAGKSLAFGFGLLLWPLQLYAARPVQETVLVGGTLERYEADASALPARLVRYPSQPDAAVSTVGMAPLRRAFDLEVEYEEGLLADEGPRTSVLLEGFVQRLAVAIVAIAEEPESTALPLSSPSPP